MSNYVDKFGKLGNLDQGNIILELGCGPNKVVDNAVGIDFLDFPCVDVVGDVFEVLADLPDNCVDAVYAYHFIEHIGDLNKLLLELIRVLKANSIMEVSVPHFSNPYYYSDPTHKAYFGLYTFAYLFETRLFKRPIPNYAKIKNAELVYVKLRFKSYRPYYLRHLIKYIFQQIFNMNYWTQELYEELFTYVIPCYEITYRVKKKDG